VAWAVVWLPQVPSTWMRVSPGAASALDRAARLIPDEAEVIVSQGVSGRLCGRVWCYTISGGGTQSFPVHTAMTYVVVAPYDGIETSSVQTQLGVIADLAGPLHATLVFERADVWLFELAGAPVRQVRFTPSPTEPAWAARTTTGSRQLHGPAATWRLVQTRQASGYVLYGTQWELDPGTYRLTVTLATSAACNVEVWDSTSSTLLLRRRVPSLDSPAAIQASVVVEGRHPAHPYTGWGPFSYSPRPPPSADSIEVRVWSPGTGSLTLYEVEMQGPGRSDLTG
jgi:hypothetical protein